MSYDFDERALALEDKLKAILKKEEVQHREKLIAQLSSGKCKNLDSAIHRFSRVLEKEVVVCVFKEHAPDTIKEKLMLQERNQMEDLFLPIEFKVFLKQPVTSYSSKTALMRDALQHGVLDQYTQAENARLLQCTERAVRYAIETLPKQTVADLNIPINSRNKVGELGQRLQKDPAFQLEAFSSKQAWVRAVLQHDEYKTLRTSEISIIGGVAEGNIANQRTIIQRGLPLPTDKKKLKIEPKIEKEIEPKIETPKLTQIDNQVHVEVLDVVQVKKIVSKTTVESLLENLYPEGIQVTDFHKLLKVVKHLKRAIKSRG